jgi:pyridoxine kinase
LASTWHDGDMDTWAFALPTIRAYFSGVGDLFSAMVLAHFDTPHASSKGTPSFTQAVSRALLTVQQILLRTHLFAVSNVGPSGAAISRSLHHSSGPVDGDGRDSRVERVTQSDGESENDRPTGSHEAKPKAKTMRMRELRIVQERALLDNANQGWPGRKLDWAAILA